MASEIEVVSGLLQDKRGWKWSLPTPEGKMSAKGCPVIQEDSEAGLLGAIQHGQKRQYKPTLATNGASGSTAISAEDVQRMAAELFSVELAPIQD
jgi:hypothetical protein